MLLLKLSQAILDAEAAFQLLLKVNIELFQLMTVVQLASGVDKLPVEALTGPLLIDGFLLPGVQVGLEGCL